LKEFHVGTIGSATSLGNASFNNELTELPPGGTANSPDGSYGSGGSSIQQELAQVEQFLSNIESELGGDSGGQPSIGGDSGGQPSIGGDSGGQPSIGGDSGGQPSIGGQSTPQLSQNTTNDLGNLTVDSSGGSDGGARSGHVGKDLDSLRQDVQAQMKDGTMSAAVGTQTLKDIADGNVSAVQQDLTGSSSS
jgi:hypothetical protein